jgi:hypothetical protein
MKKALLTLLLSLFLLIPLQASPVSEMLRTAMKSIAWVSHDTDGYCTTFTVGIPNRWATAGHCVGKNMKINGQDVIVLKEDKEHDLALLQGPEGTPLTIAKKPAELGDSVYLVGWPAKWEGERPMVFFGKVNIEPMPDEELGHRVFGIDSGGGRGMSGGPILNEKGEVVGMTEALSGGIPLVNSMVMWSQDLKDIQKFFK